MLLIFHEDGWQVGIACSVKDGIWSSQEYIREGDGENETTAPAAIVLKNFIKLLLKTEDRQEYKSGYTNFPLDI